MQHRRAGERCARRAQNWRYHPQVQAKVDAALALLASKAKPTIAFHARGGDKRVEDVQCARSLSRFLSPSANDSGLS